MRTVERVGMYTHKQDNWRCIYRHMTAVVCTVFSFSASRLQTIHTVSETAVGLFLTFVTYKYISHAVIVVCQLQFVVVRTCSLLDVEMLANLRRVKLLRGADA